MNQAIQDLLTQIQKEFDEVYYDRSSDGRPYAGDPMYDRLKAFLTAKLQKARTEALVDGMIATTQWLIDNGHLKAGKEINEMMLKSLVNEAELNQHNK